MPTELSIVIPVYGSASILANLVDRIEEAVSALSIRHFELILVNDCSPDDSWKQLRALAGSRPWLKALHLRKNSGQHNAIMAGLRVARGQRIVMMDDDLQHSPSDLAALLAALDQGYDVCYSHFRERHHALWKVAGSKFNDLVANRLLGKPKGLYLSPFKAIVKGIRDEMIRCTGPTVYLDGLILSATNNITSIEVAHHQRPDGQSGYSLRKSISLWLRMATSFSIAPLRVASLLGLACSALGFVFALAVVMQKLAHPETAVGWSSLIVVVLLMGGVQLVALGAIGEYVGRVLLNVTNRPQYVVGEHLNADEALRQDAI